jgi:gliding motility-associated-like protein
MKKLLHSPPFRLLLFCLLSWAGMQQARASHAQAGELTYFSLGNNLYRVRVTFFRDCGGITPPATFALTCRNGGCSAGTVVSATLTPPAGYPTAPGSFTQFQPYCASASNVLPCTPTSNNSGARTNTIAINYEGTVTLPPAAEWVLSVEESARPTVANITAGTLRLEATLNNLITPVGGGAPVTIQNNSPQFNTQTLPVPFVCWNQSSTISFSATDADRLNTSRRGIPAPDSLVYSLDRPLSGCNLFETYLVYPGGACQSGIDPRCATRLISCAGIASNYSATLPIAVANDTIYPSGAACNPNMITTATVRPRFTFNAQAGSFRFTPSVYNTTLDSPLNKYAVVGKVTEYRKVNGRYYKVGSVRRDFLVIVIDCGNNVIPAPPGGFPGDTASAPVITNNPDTLQLNIRSCNYTRIVVPFTDPNPGDLLTVFPPNDINTNLLQNGDIGTWTLTRNGTAAPVGTFYFQPSASTVGTRILITMRIEDNACPAKGIQYRTIVVNVIAGNRARALASAPGLGNALPPAICPGGSLLLRGAVGRPDSVRQVASGRTVAQRYSFGWSAINGSGLPTVTNTQNITVNPTVTTRYRLTITPTLGFAPGCGDTTSILVRVVPEPQVRVTASNLVVCSGTPVTLTSAVTRPDALTDSYTYQWSGPNGFTATTPTVTVSPTVASTYNLTVRGALQFGCDAATQIQLSVAPAAVAAFTRVDSVSARPGSRSLIPPIVYSFLNTATLNPVTPNFQLDSVRWTYQRVRNAQGQPVPDAAVVFSRNRTPGATVSTPALGLAGYYIITQTVNTRAAGTNCPSSSFARTIFVPNIQVPNIITPNGDNMNDVFVVNSDQFGGKLEIYNRWGRKVQEYSAYKNEWGGADQPDGTYYYYLTDRAGNKTKGWIEVVRGQ